MEERISKFMRKHKVMTIASSNSDKPYCCVVFYSFDPEKNCLYFISNPSSKHSEEIFVNPQVAGTILKPELSILKLQGVQFTGSCRMLEGRDSELAGKHYQKTFPVAHWSKERIWIIELDWIKMTDNTLGFGEKIIWGKVPRVSDKIN